MTIELKVPESLIGSQLRLHDLNGRLIADQTIDETTVDLVLPSSAASTYVLSVTTAEGQEWGRAVVVE